MRFPIPIAIAGVGYTEISRNSGRSVLDLAAEACARAIADAGLGHEQVDGVVSFSMFSDSAPTQAVASALALGPQRYSLDLNLGGQAPCRMIMDAGLAVASGATRAVVCYRALNGRSGVRVGSTQVEGAAGQYRYPLGFTAYPQYIAMWVRRYMIETGAGEGELAAVAISQRRNAARNPRALIRRSLDEASYFESPLVVDPFRVVDCTVEADGACAVVVTSLELARELPHPPAVVQAAEYVRGRGSGLDIGDSLLWEDYSRNYTSQLGPALWRSAGMEPEEIDFAELYDCFSGVVLMSIEGLGLAERGGAGELVRSGRLPINTHGGLLCEGYLHGMNTVAEAVLQIQGRAGETQLERHQACVVTSGAMMDGSALVLTAA